MTCIAMGIILSVSVKRAEVDEVEQENETTNNPISILSETHY
jgi:hypothetical protein